MPDETIPPQKFNLGQYVRWEHTHAPDDKTIAQGDGIIKEARYDGKAWFYRIDYYWVQEELISETTVEEIILNRILYT